MVSEAIKPRPARLSDAVARQLEAWISDEKLIPGTQLPTEKVLCERFGVSRAVIREAISRLKADGCVRTKQGSGAYVAARPGQGAFRLLQPLSGSRESLPRDLADVFELRYLIETGAASMAAERRTDADIGTLREALQRMRDALGARSNAVADDDAFHIAIAGATQNPQLARLQAFMSQQLSGSRAPTWTRAGHRAGRAEQAHEEHERIFEAIVAGDPLAARAAAAAHLSGAAARLGLDPARWQAEGGLSVGRETLMPGASNTDQESEP